MVSVVVEGAYLRVEVVVGRVFVFVDGSVVGAARELHLSLNALLSGVEVEVSLAVDAYIG